MKHSTLWISVFALGLGCSDNDATDDQTDEDEDNDGVIAEGEGEGGGDGEAVDFSTLLTGAAERPVPVATTMRGDATFTIAADERSIDFTLDIASGNDIVAAHIHQGGVDVAGPVIVLLFEADPPVDEEGRLASGTITDEDLAGPLVGNTIADLIEEMEAGNTYVNVHTLLFPDGAIRGQIAEGELDGGGVEPTSP